MTHQEVKESGAVAKYLQGALLEEEREEFEEHMFDCPECAGIVKADSVLRVRGGLGLTEKLSNEDEDEERRGASSGSVLLDWASGHPRLSAGVLIAASLTIFLAGCQNFFVISDLRRQVAELSRPQSFIPLRLFGTTRSDPQIVVLPQGCQKVSLWLQLGPGDKYPAYWGELIGESRAPIEVSYEAPRNFELHMYISCADLPAGSYVFKLYGMRDKDRVLIETIRFEAKYG